MKHFTVPKFIACGTVTESMNYGTHCSTVQILNYYIFTCVHMQVSNLLKKTYLLIYRF